MNKNQKLAMYMVVVVALVGGTAAFLHTRTAPSAATNTTPSSDQYAAAINGCYSKDTSNTANQPIPNNSVQNVKETSRIFINMPKDLYPQDLKDAWTTISGDATAGAVGGGFGEAQSVAPDCWSSYVDFEGTGEVDLRVKSTAAGAPDYFVRFIVSSV